MNKFNKTLAALAFAVPLAAFAQTAPAPSTPRVDQRQVNQEQRIQQGVQSGSLTQKEAGKLEKGQDHVQKVEDKAKADGKVTPKERERLQQAQNNQSKKIDHQKHDKQHDYNHDGKKDRPNKGKGNGNKQ
jgi:hypothetical protein